MLLMPGIGLIIKVLITARIVSDLRPEAGRPATVLWAAENRHDDRKV